jgi:hypothetical protein
LSFSNHLEDAIVDAVCNNVSLAVATVYVQLHTADPGEAGTTAVATETTRKAASFGASSGGTAVTDADLTWTSVAGTETYMYVSLWDVSTAGNCLGSGVLIAFKAVNAGDIFEILAGDLSFSAD